MKLNLSKIAVVFLTVALAAGYDHFFLEEIDDYRLFNIIAEFFMALLAVFLYFAIAPLRNRKFYPYINIGFYLAFLSMLMDGLDELHIHSELYTALSEKLTLVVAFTLIILGIRKWIAEFAEMNNNLEKQVITDELTGLYNRRGFLQKVKEMEVISKKEQFSLSFIIADLDDFKTYNDTMGHLEGDELLRKLGQFLKELMSENQVVGRWGGEEFAFCVLNGEIPQVVELAEKIRAKVSSFLSTDQFGNLKMTFSLGVSQVQPNEPIMHAIKRADQSLYVAKHRGKDQVVSITD
jgi:diguanylate cyclase (GGDEF)-like protein